MLELPALLVTWQTHCGCVWNQLSCCGRLSQCRHPAPVLMFNRLRMLRPPHRRHSKHVRGFWQNNTVWCSVNENTWNHLVWKDKQDSSCLKVFFQIKWTADCDYAALQSLLFSASYRSCFKIQIAQIKTPCCLLNSFLIHSSSQHIPHRGYESQLSSNSRS